MDLIVGGATVHANERCLERAGLNADNLHRLHEENQLFFVNLAKKCILFWFTQKHLHAILFIVLLFLQHIT